MLQNLGPSARGFQRLLPGQPPASPCPPPLSASSIRASLTAPEPRTDAGPCVSQACVTAPRRQGGLSQSEGTVRAALRPAPFRSAEPARPGRREGGPRPRCLQPHALPPAWDLGSRTAPPRPERAAGGRRAGTSGEERARGASRVSCAGARPRVPSQPWPGPVAATLGLPVGGAVHPRPVGDRSCSVGVQRPRPRDGHAGQVSRRPRPVWLYGTSHRNFSYSGPAPAREA